MAVHGARGWALLIAAGLLATGTGCAPGGEIGFSSRAGVTVHLDLGGEEVEEITPGGGGLLFTDDCYAGPIVVTYADGGTVEVDGPVCPGQEVVVRNGSAEIVDLAR